MYYKAVIFDLDGVIIDSHNIWIEARRKTLEHYGKLVDLKMEKELEYACKGQNHIVASKNIINIANLNVNLEDLDEYTLKIASQLVMKKVKFIDGFEKFYRNILNYKLKYAVASNTNKTFLKAVEFKLNLKKYFGDNIFTAKDVVNHKPAPDLYLLAAEKIGVLPQDCIAIDDSFIGLQAARNAGMYCIGFNMLDNPENKNIADLLVNKFSDINLEKIS